MIIALDQSFGAVRLAREKSGPKVFGIDFAPGIESGLNRVKNSGLRIVVMLTEALPASEVKVLSQYLPQADSIIPPGDTFLSMLAQRIRERRTLRALQTRDAVFAWRIRSF